MTKMHKPLALLIVIISMLHAPVHAQSLPEIQNLVVSNKSIEAAKLLKMNHAKLIRTTAQRKKVISWFDTFLLDETLGHYERSLELLNKDPGSSERELKKALAMEPHNRKLAMTYISFLISGERYREARVLIENKISAEPYFPIYGLYHTHLDLLTNKNELLSLACSRFRSMELSLAYCRLLKLMIFVKQTTKNQKHAEKTLSVLLKGVPSPEGQYLAWKLTKSNETLGHYIKLCRLPRWTNQDREDRLIPRTCAHMNEAIVSLKSVKKK